MELDNDMYSLAFAAMIDADRLDKEQLILKSAYPGYDGDVGTVLPKIPYGINQTAAIYLLALVGIIF